MPPRISQPSTITSRRPTNRRLRRRHNFIKQSKYRGDSGADYSGFFTENVLIPGVYRPSTRLLKLRRYLSTRLETAPPKLEVNFRVTHVFRSESDAKETTPAAK